VARTIAPPQGLRPDAILVCVTTIVAFAVPATLPRASNSGWRRVRLADSHGPARFDDYFCAFPPSGSGCAAPYRSYLLAFSSGGSRSTGGYSDGPTRTGASPSRVTLSAQRAAAVNRLGRPTLSGWVLACATQDHTLVRTNWRRSPRANGCAAGPSPCFAARNALLPTCLRFGCSFGASSALGACRRVQLARG